MEKAFTFQPQVHLLLPATTLARPTVFSTEERIEKSDPLSVLAALTPINISIFVSLGSSFVLRECES
jgi:hypothetical protein